MKTLVIIPTYNEKDNISRLLQAIRKLKVADLEILIVDDSSPDGTGEMVQNEAQKSGAEVHLLTRRQKEGLGAAYAAGFQWSLGHHFDYVVSMDADFSHRPDDLLKLLSADINADIVIGSRYVPAGAIVGWDLKRQLNSRLANMLTRLMLGLAPKDVTAGFKRYSRRFLESLDYSNIIASGYAFQVEMIFQAVRRGFTVIEVPIVFVDRRAGRSKISGELKRSMSIVWRLFLRREGIRQFGKFMLVGAFCAVIDWAVFAVFHLPLKSRGQTGKQMAKAGSFVVSSAVNYFLNRTWTFRSTEKKMLSQALRFYLVASLGLILNNVIFYVITSPKLLGLHDFLGLFIATAIVALWNYYANRRWTFK